MSSCFAAAILLTALLAFRNIRGLEASLILPEVVCSGEEVSVKCYICDKDEREHFAIGFENDLVGVINPAEKVLLKSLIKAPSRGKHTLSDFCLFSFFPFGLSATSLVLPDHEIFIGPKCAQQLPELVDKEIGGAIQKFQSGKEGEYWMQKHYSPGEDSSLINWTISARSDAEWVLVKAQNFGLPEKLFFNFSGLDSQMFEECLEIIMGSIFRLRQAGSNAFVWAEQGDGNYNWLSISENYYLLVRWLAKIQINDQIPAPRGDCRGIDFAELMGNIP